MFDDDCEVLESSHSSVILNSIIAEHYCLVREHIELGLREQGQFEGIVTITRFQYYVCTNHQWSSGFIHGFSV